MGSKLAQAWTTYENAKKEYAEVMNNDDVRTIEAAKFLRDSAENILHYPDKTDIDEHMLVDLNAHCEMAKAKAVLLTNGRKRKFDKPEGARNKADQRNPNKLQAQPTYRFHPYTIPHGMMVLHRYDDRHGHGSPVAQANRDNSQPFGNPHFHHGPAKSYPPY